MDNKLSERLNKSLYRMQKTVVVKDHLTRYFAEIFDKLPNDVLAILEETHGPLTYDSLNMVGFLHDCNARYLTGWEIERVLSALIEATGIVPNEYGRVQGWARSEWQYLKKYAEMGATILEREPFLVKVKKHYSTYKKINLWRYGHKSHGELVCTSRNKVNFCWTGNARISMSIEFDALNKNDVWWTAHDSSFMDVTHYYNQLIGPPDLVISNWDTTFPTKREDCKRWK